MQHKFIISGGGTGGHIFPAVAIANGIRKREPSASILFVGAKGRMEMEKVPAAGYEIIGLNIAGIKRSFSLSNLLVPFKLLGAIRQAGKILRKFRPDAVVGVGGYASGAMLYAAGLKHIPALVQEQNSFPGVTNKLLSKRVAKICVAYDKMEKFFPAEKIVITGNPVRQEITELEGKREKGFLHFDLNPDMFTVLVVGGSLGAFSINESIAANLMRFKENGIQLIWQTGKGYIEKAVLAVNKGGNTNLKAFDFIKELDMAYACADLVVSRAGAIAVSELCLVKKPCILIPYPHAAEDHQTKNAQALVDHKAAIMIKDSAAREVLGDLIVQLSSDDERRLELQNNIAGLGRPNATELIVDEIFRLIRN